jgi:hypothetical protein
MRVQNRALGGGQSTEGPNASTHPTANVRARNKLPKGLSAALPPAGLAYFATRCNQVRQLGEIGRYPRRSALAACRLNRAVIDRIARRLLRRGVVSGSRLQSLLLDVKPLVGIFP